MKQHITSEQLQEIKYPQLKTLWKWMVDKHYWNSEGVNIDGQESSYMELAVRHGMKPLLSIGQLIEFLDGTSSGVITDYWTIRCIDCWEVIEGDGTYLHTRSEELCDALWEAVKEQLNN